MIDCTIETMAATGALTDDARRWEHVMSRAFGNPPVDEDGAQRWWRGLCADRARLRGAWPTGPEPGVARRTPYAPFASFDGTINTGRGHLERADLITDVTVRPSARRNGLLTALMRADLTEAAGRGLTLAALTATEATIYRRFGFGPATETVGATLRTGPGHGLRAPARPGAVHELDLDAAPEVMDRVFALFHAASRGSHSRPAWCNDHATGVWSALTNGSIEGVHAAAHWDGRGAPDGVVTFTLRRGPAGGHGDYALDVEVVEMIAAHESAELSLWRYLASIDLARSVGAPHLNPNSPLPWALDDPRRLARTSREDLTWLRILDVPGALRARGWDGCGRLTMEVRDPLGLSGGVFALDVSPEGAEAAPTGARPEVSLGIATLGSLYLGLADPVAMAAAGLIEGDPERVAALRVLFATDRAPYNITYF